MRSRDRMAPHRWGLTVDGEIEFVSLTTETLEGALNVIRRSFFVHESVCKGVDLLSEPGATEELEKLCLDAAKDGISVVAVEVSTREVVGVAFNKTQIAKNAGEKDSFEAFSENCKCKSSKALVDFMIEVDSKIDLFEHYNVDCIFEIMFLATSPDKQKRRIGELLVLSSIKMARQLNEGNDVKTSVTVDGDNCVQNLSATPKLVSAIMTSSYSQKIAEKLGFDKWISTDYKEFSFGGKTFSERIGDEHKRCVLVAKRL